MGGDAVEIGNQQAHKIERLVLVLIQPVDIGDRTVGEK